MRGLPHNFWFGFAFLAAGLAMMVFMAADRSGLNAPLWVAELAGACFALAGASVIAQGFGMDRLGRALGLGVVYCMTVIPLWITFGASGGKCDASIGGFVLPQAVADVTCRGAFALSAVLMVACAIALTWAALKPKPRAA